MGHRLGCDLHAPPPGAAPGAVSRVRQHPEPGSPASIPPGHVGPMLHNSVQSQPCRSGRGTSSAMISLRSLHGHGSRPREPSSISKHSPMVCGQRTRTTSPPPSSARRRTSRSCSSVIALGCPARAASRSEKSLIRSALQSCARRRRNASRPAAPQAGRRVSHNRRSWGWLRRSLEHRRHDHGREAEPESCPSGHAATPFARRSWRVMIWFRLAARRRSCHACRCAALHGSHASSLRRLWRP